MTSKLLITPQRTTLNNGLGDEDSALTARFDNAAAYSTVANLLREAGHGDLADELEACDRMYMGDVEIEDTRRRLSPFNAIHAHVLERVLAVLTGLVAEAGGINLHGFGVLDLPSLGLLVNAIVRADQRGPVRVGLDHGFIDLPLRSARAVQIGRARLASVGRVFGSDQWGLGHVVEPVAAGAFAPRRELMLRNESVAVEFGTSDTEIGVMAAAWSDDPALFEDAMKLYTRPLTSREGQIRAVVLRLLFNLKRQGGSQAHDLAKRLMILLGDGPATVGDAGRWTLEHGWGFNALAFYHVYRAMREKSRDVLSEATSALANAALIAEAVDEPLAYVLRSNVANNALKLTEVHNGASAGLDQLDMMGWENVPAMNYRKARLLIKLGELDRAWSMLSDLAVSIPQDNWAWQGTITSALAAILSASGDPSQASDLHLYLAGEAHTRGSAMSEHLHRTMAVRLQTQPGFNPWLPPKLAPYLPEFDVWDRCTATFDDRMAMSRQLNNTEPKGGRA